MLLYSSKKFHKIRLLSLQIKMLRSGLKVKYLAQGHETNKWWSRNLNSNLPLKSLLFALNHINFSHYKLLNISSISPFMNWKKKAKFKNFFLEINVFIVSFHWKRNIQPQGIRVLQGSVWSSLRAACDFVVELFCMEVRSWKWISTGRLWCLWAYGL